MGVSLQKESNGAVSFDFGPNTDPLLLINPTDVKIKSSKRTFIDPSNGGSPTSIPTIVILYGKSNVMTFDYSDIDQINGSDKPDTAAETAILIGTELFSGGGGNGNGVVLTNRQLIVNNSETPGIGVAGLFTPDHWSEFEDGAPTEGQWVAAAQFEAEEQPKMGFVRVSTLETPITQSEGMMPFYTQGGQLRVGIPQFPENAVPLALLDGRIPASPATGNYRLRSVNGVVSWATE